MNDKHFIDWESHVFGYGYGSGEWHIIKALKEFMDLLEEDRNYSYQVLEKHFGELSAWLLINALCHADILEYGTSPRYGWLNTKGEILRDFIKDKDIQSLYDLCMHDEEYIHCYPQTCNCDKPCNNPLFK